MRSPASRPVPTTATRSPLLAVLCLALLEGAVRAQQQTTTCRWSWRKFRCVASTDDPTLAVPVCRISWRRLRCAIGEQTASKAAASKVASATPTSSGHASQDMASSPKAASPSQATSSPPQATPASGQAARPWVQPMQRAMMLQQRERTAEAISSYEEAVKLFDAPAHTAAERMQFGVTVNTNLGLALQSAQRLTEAVTAFDAALAAHPSNADGHHNRGNALYASQKYAEAADAYTRAVSLNANDAESYFRLGNARDKLDDHEAAAQAFTTAVTLEPTDTSAAYNLANAYHTLGRTDDAVRWYRKALLARPRDAGMTVNLGHALDAGGRFDEAIDAFTAALALEPTNAGAYTALGHARKSTGQTERAVEAYRHALAIAPEAAGAYAGLGSVLRSLGPTGAATESAAAASVEGSSQQAEEARRVQQWLDASPPPLPSARAEPREWPAVRAAAVYPEAFEGRAAACPAMSMAEAVALGAEALARRGPTLLKNASSAWLLSDLSDDDLVKQVGKAPMRMLVMPIDVHPTLDTPRRALVEPAASAVYFADYLRLLDRLATTEEFAVYVAQLNLLRLPPLLRQVCLPEALPKSKLTMANLWVGGHSMKNGLHFDNYDNLLFQLTGTKRALIFPPTDSVHLYYNADGVNIRRHAFNLSEGFASETVHETMRKNVAWINVFDEHVGTSHPAVHKATPSICELGAGDALFLPKGWHHAVISAAEGRRNMAVNMWYDLRGQATPLERISALDEMFQVGCGAHEPVGACGAHHEA